MEKEYYLCHSGSPRIEDEKNGIAVLGCVYVFEGVWTRSPEDVKGKDRNPVMRLTPLWRDATDKEIAGDIGCFTEIEGRDW